MTSTDLAPVSGELERNGPATPLLPMPVASARAAMVAYQELCAAVLGPEDWIGRPGERESFVKRSGWQKLATFYGVSTELVGDTILERDADGVLVRAGARARAIARDGRYADGGGACGRNEPRFANARGRQKIEHDLPSTAETRALNRAVSNLVGFGAVSAEEIDGDVRAGGDGPDLPRWARDIPDDAIDRVGNYLATILRAGGHPEPERGALAIGSAIHNHCGGFPDACARLVRLLEQAVAPDVPWTEAGTEPEAPAGDDADDLERDVAEAAAYGEAPAKPPEFDGTDDVGARPTTTTTEGETAA